MNKLVIALCSGGQVPITFVGQYGNLMVPTPIPTVITQGLYIHENRNRAVYGALEDVPEWDYLLFLDTDMVFPACLRACAEFWTEPIVGGLYYQRKFPETEPIPGNFYSLEDPRYELLMPSHLWSMGVDVGDVPPDAAPGIYPCDVVGTGCMGIRRDLLESWPDEFMPMFHIMTSHDGRTTISEDVYFCWNAKRQGIQPVLDTRIQCGHQNTFTAGTATYRSTIALKETDG